ncbi:immunity 53 family protein [Paenibacillus popilliae]|uniref:Rhodanese-related sulfurtransferase n=1 Tax=Paenibacillus popilliae ATCC 14706 TaxID=1212764 RepID=M9LH78_PAEPP|nr:immunity 53 family protein [Paenibacillus popilliae]GAC42095.1 rhodanese-related sulfurtransferase [Paenibacillus popilliae ATCC 14706]
MEILKWLQEWYFSQCNGDWEHQHGISIETLDNPGWYVTINLNETELENKQVDTIEINRTKEDWIYCKIKDGCFTGAGGSGNLEEILKIFYQWATN